jgi:copper chaperone CopZ
MKRYSVIVFLLLAWFAIPAKILSVKIGVNGLTCPQCTRSVEMQIRKLSFVKEVSMNLEHTEGVITFKDNETVDFHKIAKAIVDAGFTVRYLSAEIKNELQEPLTAGVCYTIDNTLFHFAGSEKKEMNDTIRVFFIGKEYQEKKEFLKWKGKIKPACKSEGNKEVYTVSMI